MRILRLICPIGAFLLLPLLGQAQSTYRWNVASGSMGTAANWSPARNAPNNADILEFDGSLVATATATVDAGYTLAQLRFTNGVTATLSANAGRAITLNGTTGTDFLVAAGTTVTFNGVAKNDDITLTLNGSATADIGGTLIFTNGATAPGQNQSNHRLTGATNSVTFLAGSTFRADGGQLGAPLGLNANTATFNAGSTFVQNSGDSPLGTNGDVATFASGSSYIYSAGNFSAVGRTYGHLELQGSVTVTSGAMVIRNNLAISGGTASLSPTSLTFSGTAAQSVTGAGALTLGTGTAFTLNNAAGLTLARPVTVLGSLSLTSGILTATATNSLTLGAAATISGGSASSFVNGPLTRTLASTAANTSLVYPIGVGTIYRPLTLTLTQSANTATTYTAQQVEGSPTNRTVSGDVARVSRIRYFTLAKSGATTFTGGSVKLSFGLDDQVDAAAKLRIARSNGAAWASQGGTGNPGTNGTTFFAGDITSSVAFTQLGDFVLASTSLDNSSGNNPLPVELTAFTAQRQAAGVLLKWATASERNNARFEVERSADGKDFQAIATVAGHGSTTQAHTYTLSDQQPLPGLSYYRLRQVDTEGAFTYSPVRAVATELAAAVYPNPAREVLYLPAGAAGLPYQVLNNLGQMLARGIVPDNGRIGVGQLPAGSYLLQTGAGVSRVMQRFQRQE